VTEHPTVDIVRNAALHGCGEYIVCEEVDLIETTHFMRYLPRELILEFLCTVQSIIIYKGIVDKAFSLRGFQSRVPGYQRVLS
jgi:hypothetical protein